LSLSKEHPPKIGVMQSKACGQGKILPQKMKLLWDEKLPRIVDKGQHGLLDPLDPIKSFGVLLQHALHDDIFPLQKYKFIKLKSTKL